MCCHSLMCCHSFQGCWHSLFYTYLLTFVVLYTYILSLTQTYTYYESLLKFFTSFCHSRFISCLYFLFLVVIYFLVGSCTFFFAVWKNCLVCFILRSECKRVSSNIKLRRWYLLHSSLCLHLIVSFFCFGTMWLKMHTIHFKLYLVSPFSLHTFHCGNMLHTVPDCLSNRFERK